MRGYWQGDREMENFPRSTLINGRPPSAISSRMAARGLRSALGAARANFCLSFFNQHRRSQGRTGAGL